jgi:site-specific DNA recombinase
LVQRRLSINNPKVTPPRVVNGPTLLAGLAVCASCGSGMTKSGTRRRGKIYSYYSCAGCKLGGRSVCKGGNIPLEKLDGLILENVTQQLFNPERMGVILGALVKRTNTKDAALDDRWNRLQAERKDKQEKLARLYRAIEDGIVELDDDLKVRIATIKQERDIVQTSLDRIQVQATNSQELTPDRIAAFAKLAHDKLLKGDAQARRAYLRSIITRIEVSKEKVRIIGDTNVLAGAVSGRKDGPQNVRGYVRNWRTQEDQ